MGLLVTALLLWVAATLGLAALWTVVVLAQRRPAPRRVSTYVTLPTQRRASASVTLPGPRVEQHAGQQALAVR